MEETELVSSELKAALAIFGHKDKEAVERFLRVQCETVDDGEGREKDGEANENGARARPEAASKSGSLQFPPQGREKYRSNHNVGVEQLSKTSQREKSNGSCEDGGLRAPSDSNYKGLITN